MTKDPFRNRDFVANFDDLVEEYKARSAATRASTQMLGSLAYGAGANEKLDLFFPRSSTIAGRVICPILPAVQKMKAINRTTPLERAWPLSRKI